MRAGTKAERRRDGSPRRLMRPPCIRQCDGPRADDGHHERAARRRLSRGRLRRPGRRSAMTSSAIPLESARRDALQWGICFAVAVALHGAAAVALLHHALSDSGFDAGAPVVMIELPEAPAAFATPPTELAPGPTEPETEQTPPPKEEAKPPEEVAEVALPVPEPPKLEPPAEEKAPTAMPSITVPLTPAPPVAGAAVAPSDAVVRRWESALVAHIERFK